MSCVDDEEAKFSSDGHHSTDHSDSFSSFTTASV